ncbi:MAG: lipid-binding SYLF domain-containing protein [Geminicoccaceae bacterium]
MSIARRSLLGGLALLAGTALSACSTTESERADLEARAQAAREDLYRSVPAARDLAANSAGVLVFPSVVQGGLIFGAQYGQGVLFEGGKATGFYNIAGGSWGLQIGAQSFSQIYMFTTPEALQTFKSTKGFEVGAGLDFALASMGTSGSISTSTLQKPVVVWVFGQQGLMAGVTVAGQKITELTSK